MQEQRIEGLVGFLEGLWDHILEEYRSELLYVLFFTVSALVRSAGRTIESGHTGLKFSFGRARGELQPGFHPLIPFLQVVRTLPTRQRTLDLPKQRVTTLDGLVYNVDANLVFRVVDLRKALIEIDDLDQGMLQVLGLGVQEVLRELERDALRVSADLDQRLAVNLQRSLEAWGVVVERAGFTSIAPSARTIRLTQLSARVRERHQNHALLTEQGLPRRPGLAALGSGVRIVSRTRALRRETFRQQARRRVRLVWQKVGEDLVPLREGLPPGWPAYHTRRAITARRAEERAAEAKKAAR